MATMHHDRTTNASPDDLAHEGDHGAVATSGSAMARVDFEGTSEAAAREAKRSTPSPADPAQSRSDAAALRTEELEASLHAISHSIRSPLVALKGFTSLLAGELGAESGAKSHHFLARIDEAERRIEWRLDDLGELVALNEQVPIRSWTDPASLVDALGAEFKPALDETGMRILASRDAPFIHCDRGLLETALRHLIGNALQHGVPSEPRHVQIEIERFETETVVSVLDHGPGMDEGQRRRAFEPFDAAGARTRRFDDGRESTGIGLSLVRRIARAHGGEARITSEPGRGTRVVMTFPHEESF